MARILVVEDDENLRYGMRFNLERGGHEVLTAASAEEAASLLTDAAFDLILLDIMLPGRSGFEFLEDIRRAGCSTPVLMVTARTDETDVVRGLTLGADDYIRKPFGVQELLARIDAALRHATGFSESPAIRVGPWRIETDNLTAHGPGGPLAMTAIEIEILRVLADPLGAVHTREDLLSRVWGIDSRTPTRTLDNHIARIRKKIEDDPRHPRIIETVHGVGYRMVDPA